jgi:alpha-1,2-mannosyltransferase
MHTQDAPRVRLAGLTELRARWLTVVAVLVAVVALSVTVTVVVGRNTPLDFYVYYMAGHLAAHGQNAYRISGSAWDQLARELAIGRYTAPYRYPPYTAALVRLLLPLGPRVAMIVWEVLSALALLAGAWLVGCALGGRCRVPLALGALVFFVPIYNMLGDGQVDGLAFFFLCLALWGLTRDRDLPLGVGVAVAAALKLTPALLIVYLLWRRRWRAAVTALAALVVLSLATLPLVGPQWFSDYGRQAVALTEPQKIALTPQNQTALGVAGRLLLEPTTWSWRVWSNVGVARIARALSVSFALALVGATAVVLWPRRRLRPARADGGGERRLGVGRERAAPQRLAVEEQLGFGMVVAASLVIGPFTFYHQFVWLLLVLLVLADRFVAARQWRAFALVVGLVLAIDLNELLWIGGSSATVQRFWEWPYRLVITSGLWRSLSLPFVAAVVAWALSLALVIAGRRRRAGDSRLVERRS